MKKVFNMHLNSLCYHSLESEYVFGLVFQLDLTDGKNRVQQLIPCNGTALPFLDSEAHCKSVDLKMYYHPQVGHHT